MKTLEAPNVTMRSGTTWFARLGISGILFFLIKGLLWLGVPVLLELWAMRR
jgi:hypothetical protein